MVITLVAIWLTYLGFGSIAGWAFRFAWAQFGALGTLMSRALPLLMITLLVYFSGELWQLSARMTRRRLWQVIGFLALVALIFVVSTIRDEVRALTVSTSTDPLYRQRFFEPLIADVAVSLAGRDAYLDVERTGVPPRQVEQTT